LEVAFSPDGKWIATAGGDGVKIWNAAISRAPQTLDWRGGEIWALAISPDCRRLVTASADGTAQVWEAQGGKQLLTLKGHIAPVFSAAFSRDGQRIVTGSADQTVKLWDASTGQQLRTLRGHAGAVKSVAFSPDEQRIATGSGDQTAKIWETATGKLLLTLEGYSGFISSVVFSPDGRRLLTGSWDMTVKEWEVASGKQLRTFRTPKGSGSWIRSVAYSPDGQWVAAGAGTGGDGVILWDAATGQQSHSLRGFLTEGNSIAFSPDSQRIVACSEGGAGKMWDTANGLEMLTLQGPSEALAFSPDGQQIFTCLSNHTARIWEAARAEQVAAWHREERAEEKALLPSYAEQVFDQRRERIARDRGDEGAIKQWLVLAPIAPPPGQSITETLDLEPIDGEARLSPTARESAVVLNGTLEWQVAVGGDDGIDFRFWFGPDRIATNTVGYAVTYIHSDKEQRGLRMLVSSGAASKVYLNGKQKYRYCPWPLGSETGLGHDTVRDIVLNEGLNVIVFKVVNYYGWWGSIHLTEADGKPVKGVKVTLTPPEPTSTRASE
jgi:hypothetical protein